MLTDLRLILIQARVGAFGPLEENRGVIDIARPTIAAVEQYESHIRFICRDGRAIDLFVVWSESKLSNQRRFLRDVPRLLTAGAPADAAATAAAGA